MDIQRKKRAVMSKRMTEADRFAKWAARRAIYPWDAQWDEMKAAWMASKRAKR